MYRQLTKEDRLRIYEGLNRNESLSEIGRAEPERDRPGNREGQEHHSKRDQEEPGGQGQGSIRA